MINNRFKKYILLSTIGVFLSLAIFANAYYSSNSTVKYTTNYSANSINTNYTANFSRNYSTNYSTNYSLNYSISYPNYNIPNYNINYNSGNFSGNYNLKPIIIRKEPPKFIIMPRNCININCR